jgi:hypothetical protein
MGRLRDLDHKAMNARWGLLVAPIAWLAYRAGRRRGGSGESRGAYALLGPLYGAVFNRGREEGEALPERPK